MYAPHPQLNARNHISTAASAPAPHDWLRVPTPHVATRQPTTPHPGDLVVIVHPKDALFYLTLCSALFHNGAALQLITRQLRVRALPVWWLGPSPMYGYTGPISLNANAAVQLLGT